MIPQWQIDEALDYMDIIDPNSNNGRRFSSGVAMELHMRLVEAGLRKLNMHNQLHQNDVERLIAKGSALLTVVRGRAKEIVDAVESKDGAYIDRKMLAEALAGYYLEGLMQFNKEEMQILMSTWIGLKTAEEFR